MKNGTALTVTAKKHGKNGTVSTFGGGGSFGGRSDKCLTDLTKRKNPVKWNLRRFKQYGVFLNMFTGTSLINKSRSVNRPDNLKEFASVNGERITERKKETFNIALSMKDKGEDLQDETLTKRAERSLKCSSFRYIATVNGQAQTLYTHRCKGRHCQECQRIKAYIWQKKNEAIFPKLEENYPNAKYLFATFTIKNPKITDLRVVLSLMNKAANRLFKMKKYKDFILGGIRSTEITRGKSGADECHPHFHFLLMVKGNYGKKYYVNQEDWGKDWGDCLAYECDRVGYPYNPVDYPRGFPIVDVVRAMDKERKIEITNKNIKTSGEAIINYVLKYSVKGSDILDHKKGKNDDWFFEFDKQIKGCRMITPVGVFKKYLSEIKKDPFDYDIEKAKIEERLGQGYQVNKAIFKKGDYKLENKKDSEGYILEALEAKA
ncbi:TPA: protein rep, partial [Klebsiella pneumoniae]|nr:protein rep [Klebsiella quasipneumoniae]HDZ1350809.1 protein rep [Klebsiella pneumoniae]